METHSGKWEFDAARLLLRNRTTGEAIALREIDTPEALLQKTVHLADNTESAKDVRGFTAAVRHACNVVFQSSLRDVYCCPDRPLRRVDWQGRARRNHS